MFASPLIWMAAVLAGEIEGFDIPQTFLPIITAETVDDVLSKYGRSMIITLLPNKFKKAKVQTSKTHKELLACAAVYFKVFSNKSEHIPFFLLDSTDGVMITGAERILNCPSGRACYTVLFNNAETLRHKAFTENIDLDSSFKESCLEFMGDFQDMYADDEVPWFQGGPKDGEL
eukprot:GEMP01077457.1.p2 GENE.GEMP01077457.1~~GEMP01077457.1.p2  ORF type:complete len:174 (-),score=45.24 GEMP01077457.1:489-1010(-)